MNRLAPRAPRGTPVSRVPRARLVKRAIPAPRARQGKMLY